MLFIYVFSLTYYSFIVNDSVVINEIFLLGFLLAKYIFLSFCDDYQNDFFFFKTISHTKYLFKIKRYLILKLSIKPYSCDHFENFKLLRVCLTKYFFNHDFLLPNFNYHKAF